MVLIVNIGRDKFHNTLKSLCMLVPRKRGFFRTTDSNHLFIKHSPLVKCMTINKPEQLWLSDITYLRTAKGTMTQKYDPYENAIAESVNEILKQEFDISSYRTTKQQCPKISVQDKRVPND